MRGKLVRRRMTKRGATREETTVYYDDDVHGLNEPTAEEVARLVMRQQSNPTFALSQSLAPNTSTLIGAPFRCEMGVRLCGCALKGIASIRDIASAGTESRAAASMTCGKGRTFSVRPSSGRGRFPNS